MTYTTAKTTCVPFLDYREELPLPSILPGLLEPIRVRRVKNDEEFYALRETWNALLEKSASLSVFMTWEWMSAWWRNFGGGRKLFILLAERSPGKEIIGIAPLYIDNERLFNIIDVRKLVFLGNERVGSDFLDFIMMPGMEQEALAAFFQFFRKARNVWDVIQLGAVREGSLTVRFLSDAARPGYRFFETGRSRCPYVALPDSNCRFLENLDGNMRRDLKKKTRNLMNRHTVTLHLNGSGAGLSGCLGTLFTQHQEGFGVKRYGMRQISSFSGDDIRRFHEEIIPRFYENGWLRIYYLACDGVPVASLYAFSFKNRFFCYQSGFLSSWRRWSPGTVLLGICIKECIDQGYAEFHFLRGNESYKSRWTKKSAALLTLTGVNQTMRGAICAAYYGGKQLLKNLLDPPEEINHGH